MSVYREGNWPRLMRQGQGGSVMRMRVLVSFLARDPLLKLLLRLAQVVEQARQLCLILPIEVCSERFRPPRHAQEMYDERLIRVG